MARAFAAPRRGQPTRGLLAFFLTAATALPAVAAERGSGQGPLEPMRREPGLLFFAGVEANALIPVGTWTDGGAQGTPALEAPRFSAGPAGHLALGWSPLRSRFFALTLEGGYTAVGTEAPPGGSASARLYTAAVGGILDMPGRGSTPFALELHGSLGVLVPTGEAEADGVKMPYDFLDSTLFGRTGARLVARLPRGFEAFAGADFLAGPGGVQHPGVEPRTIMGLVPALGLRYWFGS